MADNKKNKTRKQTGGKQLYANLNQITPEEIEKIFCKGRTITDLEKSDTPIFILKWGPPGSGKSSEKVTEIIERVTRVNLDNYMNFSSDEIVESVLPFRHETALEKAIELRIRANVNTKDYSHAKQLLISEKGKIREKELIKEIDVLLEEWKAGQPIPRRWIESGDFQRLLQSIVLKRTSDIYVKYRKTMKNGVTKKTLFDKMNSVLQKAYSENVNIIYETMGSGYGTSEETIQIDDRTARRLARGKTVAAPVTIFENTWEGLLGKIEYNDETREPIRVELSDTPDAIPRNYKIIVVYPILNGEIIKERALRRSIRMFTKPEELSVEGASEAYKALLKKYASEIYLSLTGNTSKKLEIEDLIQSYIEEEKASLSFENADELFLDSIKELMKNSDKNTVAYPLYRALPVQKIYDTIEQAFRYSVDYFLKQYLFLGRIDQVIYVSTL